MPPSTSSDAEEMALQGKVCVVTGANSGIGKEVARGLLARGAHVVMACRNMGACEQARAELLQQQQAEADAQRASGGGASSSSGRPRRPGTAECSQVDVADYESVRAFARRHKAQLASSSPRAPLALLVNNAGVMGAGALPGGRDSHLVANHLGPYLLTRLMLPAMERGGRIVNVASRAHYAGKLTIDGQLQLQQEPTHWFWQYGRSKLCNVLFTAELQRRLSSSGSSSATDKADRMQRPAPQGVVVSSVSPGLVATSLFKSLPGWMAAVAMPLVPFVGRTPAQGADSVLYAATSASLSGGPGTLFIHDRKPMTPSDAARDASLADRLWRLSERLVGLDGPQDQTYV